MDGVNVVILAGRLGKDPDVHTFDDGSKVANVTLATSMRAYKTKSGNEIPERTEWHNLVMRGGNATLAEKYLKKGRTIHVVGSLRYREYESNGQKKYATEVVVDSMEFLDSVSSNNTATPTESSNANVSNSNITEHVPAGEIEGKEDLPF